jgi:hypothetical protein
MNIPENTSLVQVRKTVTEIFIAEKKLNNFLGAHVKHGLPALPSDTLS